MNIQDYPFGNEQLEILRDHNGPPFMYELRAPTDVPMPDYDNRDAVAFSRVPFGQNAVAVALKEKPEILFWVFDETDEDNAIKAARAVSG